MFHFIMVTSILVTIIIFLVVFYKNIILPFVVSVPIFLIFTSLGFLSVNISRLSILPRLMIVLYSLPLSVTSGYVFSRDYRWWKHSRLIGLIGDPILINHILVVGILGLLGLLSGMYLAGQFCSQVKKTKTTVPCAQPKYRKTLDFVSFYVFLLIALLLSWISAPDKTILTVAYSSEGTETFSQGINFNSLYLFSYIIIILLSIDVEHEYMKGRVKVVKWKSRSILVATMTIVIVFEVLRGARDSIGLIAALMALYLTRSDYVQVPSDRNSTIWYKIRKLILPTIIVILVFISLGAVRSQLSRVENVSSFSFTEILSSGFVSSTWAAVLLTNLGMADQYHNGFMEYYYGRTYLDYFLSLPPGVLTAALGIERPLEATHSPNWWFSDLSIGGIHPALVPFKNFGILGVVVILCIYGFFIARCEIANISASFWSRLIYGAVVTSSFKWFWYGDMNIIRGLIIAILVGFSYKAWLSFANIVTMNRPIHKLT